MNLIRQGHQAHDLQHHLHNIWLQNRRASFYIELIKKQKTPEAKGLLYSFHWKSLQLASNTIDVELATLTKIFSADTPVKNTIRQLGAA